MKWLLWSRMDFLPIFLFLCAGLDVVRTDLMHLKRKQAHMMNTIEHLTKRIEILDNRLADLSHRCSELSRLKRGYPGAAGPPGPQGRDGLSGLSGRDGVSGRDGRDCPCQSGRRMVEDKFGASFASRNKRTADLVLANNASFVRFGKATCPDIEGVVALKGGRTTIDYSKTNPTYECSSLHEGPKKQEIPGFHLFPEMQFMTPKYSVKYRVRHHSPFKNNKELHGNEVPCVACLATKVESTLMLQGVAECPRDWIVVYHGYVMSENWNHLRSENICVDRHAEKLKAPIYDGKLTTLTAIEAVCHGKSCGTEVESKAVNCVVCMSHQRAS